MRFIRNISFTLTHEFWAVILCGIGAVLMCCIGVVCVGVFT